MVEYVHERNQAADLALFHRCSWTLAAPRLGAQRCCSPCPALSEEQAAWRACEAASPVWRAAQVGAERFNLFRGCPSARSATMVLRGGSDQFIDEAERSLHDAIMIVRRALKNSAVVAGGGAIDMELSRCARCPCPRTIYDSPIGWHVPQP